MPIKVCVSCGSVENVHKCKIGDKEYLLCSVCEEAWRGYEP